MKNPAHRINKKGPNKNPAPFKIQYPMKNRDKNKWKKMNQAAELNVFIHINGISKAKSIMQRF